MGLKLPDPGTQPTSEPNVVPMIDILLVLLIIFMMQVPLARKVMDAQVPPASRGDTQSQGPSNNIVLELKADGTYEINKEPVTKQTLDQRFHAIYDNRPQKILFVKSAPNRTYQEVIEAMDIARGTGVQVIGFTPPDETGDEGN
ncbi:MAG: biopolymer transporter ExbD [Gemmatimonadota bacterium]|nr:biopolymer transporter ExbD [Gemmatimonadota bacterium]MDH3368578.1 biopolymer transporter ExbD [Gemmatimonadota bacterium]MDH3476833.1 biopolymer transporter ExbD [Gemmatimonadota bacterium]MDH3571398.1 biopolymer transporter ExbD [Gemmatimonadota bacterium]MDH5550487.1 biopolymer transporter ExbD [Gemmatimonadota bacterium]